MERIPPRQHPYALALDMGFDALVSSDLPPEKLEALGAERAGHVIRLPALNRRLLPAPAPSLRSASAAATTVSP